jgi:hypothetical protein
MDSEKAKPKSKKAKAQPWKAKAQNINGLYKSKGPKS